MKKYRSTKYNVTNDGIIVTDSGFVMQPREDKDGYLVVKLFINNEYKTLRIHRLVAELFSENYNEKLQVNHKDGCKTNNNYTNLEWVTASENLKHAYATGLAPRGEDASLAKLTEDEVIEIKHALKAGLRDFEVANTLGINREVVSKIRHKKIWGHVLPDLAYPTRSTKLTAEDIPKIRELSSIGLSGEEIGRRYGVAGGTISGILNGKTWKNY